MSRNISRIEHLMLFNSMWQRFGSINFCWNVSQFVLHLIVNKAVLWLQIPPLYVMSHEHKSVYSILNWWRIFCECFKLLVWQWHLISIDISTDLIHWDLNQWLTFYILHSPMQSVSQHFIEFWSYGLNWQYVIINSGYCFALNQD